MPGGIICSVMNCKSNSKTAKKSGEDISFHYFPKDILVRSEWIRKCARSKNFDPNHKRICSKHFVEADYEDEIYARVMNTKPKKLKKQAIPSLFLETTVNENVCDRPKLMELNQRKTLIESLVQQSEVCEPTAEPTKLSKCSKCQDLEKSLDELQIENQQLKLKIKLLNEKNNENLHLRKHLTEKNEQ